MFFRHFSFLLNINQSINYGFNKIFVKYLMFYTLLFLTITEFLKRYEYDFDN